MIPNSFMFVYFTILLSLLSLCISEINIKDAGIGPIYEGDIALIFYLTVENASDKDLEISVYMKECCELSKDNQNDCRMFLIGGHMGMLYKRYTKNVTLIYPNLYLFHRQGSCTIAIKYKNDKFEKVMTKLVEFKTNITMEDRNPCPTLDTDPTQDCKPQDCVIKYSGEKSFFNPSTKECEDVPLCLNNLQKSTPETAYSWTNNVCMNLNDSVTNTDLEKLENNQIDTTSDSDGVAMPYIDCHRGDIDSNGDCICQSDWKTNLDDDDDDVYEPSLLRYHMCNVEGVASTA
ncbi:hypothetical protein JTB14_015193 [Gonioctena quinquepunctata]|nr:hypothetical protein JTB14_015193 [Gonioctena quinquepunctata]